MIYDGALRPISNANMNDISDEFDIQDEIGAKTVRILSQTCGKRAATCHLRTQAVASRDIGPADTLAS